MRRVVVIGAGIGGLTTAAVLSRQGLDVTVLEAHVYPGGCAGTFTHKGYRFDAGATLAGGFYHGGPMDLIAKSVGIEHWPARVAEPAMVVHLRDGSRVVRWTDERRYAEHVKAFGMESETFWNWQETTAEALWSLALRSPDWPPQTLQQLLSLIRVGLSWIGDESKIILNPNMLVDAFRPIAARLRNTPQKLRTFVDAQLLIAAQTTSAQANALYGASALDLPRRGIVHLEGGMGSIAETLAEAVRNNGGRVHYRNEVKRVVIHKGKPIAVETRRGNEFLADIVIFNLPPWNIARLLGDNAPSKLQNLPARPQQGWGAFMLYLGVDQNVVSDEPALHHQVIAREPLGEGNSIFLSISPAWDMGRAPQGKRALTISTHTNMGHWWNLYERDRLGYESSKRIYTQRILEAAERAIPGLCQAADLILPGTPVTFDRFTRRAWGWVGGFPQVDLFQAWGPRLGPGMWMVGDSIFPGQSIAAVALGGMRVARDIDFTLRTNRLHRSNTAYVPSKK